MRTSLTVAISLNSSRPLLSKQYVTLIGPHNAQFAAAVSAMDRIFNYMAAEFPVGELRRNPSPPISLMDTIQLDTRYLTPTDQAMFSDCPLSNDIDPHHVLQSIVDGGKYRYTVDNVVTCEELFVNHLKK